MLQCIKLDDVLEISIKKIFIWDCHTVYHNVFISVSISFLEKFLLFWYALFLQMHAGVWRRSIHVLLVVYVTFHLGTATTCISQCKSDVRIDANSVGLQGNIVDPHLSSHNEN